MYLMGTSMASLAVAAHSGHLARANHKSHRGIILGANQDADQNQSSKSGLALLGGTRTHPPLLC